MTQTNKSSQYVPGRNLLGALAVVLLALAVRPSQAAVGDLVFTIEPPLLQESRVTCLSGLGLETFNEIPVGDYASLDGSIGDYTDPNNAAPSIRIFAQAATGGARFPETGATRNFISTPSSYLLTLDQPAGYFGFWWSAGDGNNKVTVNMADGSSQVFTTQSILDSGAVLGVPGGGQNGHYGNPTGAQFGGQLDTELFAFVNIFATNPNAKIESLLFEQVQGAGGEFESDNHTVCADILDATTGRPIPQVGSITIAKQTAPADGAGFSFLQDIDNTGRFSLNDGDSKTFSDVAAGAYTVTEDILGEGFRLVDLRCDDDSSLVPSTGDTANGVATINLEAGETVTCTFSNSQDDIIFVQKQTLPAGGTGFDFTLAGPTAATFTLDDGGIRALEVDPGNYILTETEPGPDYDLTEIDCTIFGPGETDENPAPGDLSAGSVNLTLAAGQAVFCLFTNEKPFDLTIVKAAVGGDGTFAFEQTGNSDVDFTDFSLTTQGGTAQTTLTDLPAGFLEIEETAPTGWELTDIECVGVTDDDWASNFPRAGLTASPGDDITCTFTNVKGPFDLTIVKEAVGGDGTFAFEQTVNSDVDFTDFSLTTQGGTAQTTLTDLPAGFLEIEEIVPAGWALTDLECVGVTDDDWGSNFPRARLTASPGDDITCTFANKRTVGPGPGGPEPIPAVSLWGLGLLSLLLAAVGWSRSR